MYLIRGLFLSKFNYEITDFIMLMMIIIIIMNQTQRYLLIDTSRSSEQLSGRILQGKFHKVKGSLR